LNVVGTIKKVKFLNESTNWCVIQFVDDDGNKFMAKGTMGALYPGYKLSLDGAWEDNKKGAGKVFQVNEYQVMPPEKSEGIFLFLTSGIFRGMTKNIARGLVDLYGDKSLSLLDRNINILLTVPGVGSKTFMKIKDSYQESRPKQDLVFTLINDFKFSFTEALVVVEAIPEHTLTVLEKAPYSAYFKLSKIPFSRYDQVIVGRGFPVLDPQRVREVIQHQLKISYKDGHTVMPYESVVRATMSYLKCDRYIVENEIDYLLEKRKLHKSDHGRPYLQSKWMYVAEKEIANRLSLIMSTPPMKPLVFEPDNPALDKLKGHQLRAVVAPFEHKVSVITGRPGSGKTTLLRTMLKLLEEQNLSFLAVSPTGKAAQRLREVTGRDCCTVHRALGATRLQDEFTYNDLNPLSDYDVVVVDEMSMLDTNIMRSLLRAIPYSTRLVLIGDVEQLPSVGVGAVYRDLIKSKCLPVYWLTEVLRITNKDGSLPKPLVAANHIREGRYVELENDHEWVYEKTANNFETKQKITEIIKSLIDDGVSKDEVQVFAPTNNDDLGVGELNALVKKCFKPDGHPFIEKDDKIMQRKNDYDLDVYNGDIGNVVEVFGEPDKLKADEKAISVDMSGRQVEFAKKALNNVTLAYAITGHKSQGSEYPHVIIAIPDHYFSLMDRYWLYTLVTRCQKKVYLVGNEKVIRETIKNQGSHLRVTLLKEQMQRFLPTGQPVFKD
jgi:exodeoxyribonuclease V alpha subunit